MGRKTNQPKGRRPRLDDEMVGRICGQVKKGNTIRTSCLACGISQATYYDWKARGEEDRTAFAAWKASKEGPKPPESTKFTRFLDDLEHAEAVAQQRLVAAILAPGTPWKAKLEILKRRFPKEYGDKTSLSNPDGSPLAPMGGPPITVSFKFDAPPGDDPFIWDDNTKDPPDPDEEPPADAPAPVG